MFFKSIRWRLQLWYGLILVVVLVGFGATAYQLQRGRQMRRVDVELQRRLSGLSTALRLPPERQRGPGAPPAGQPGPDEAPLGGPGGGPPFRGGRRPGGGPGRESAPRLRSLHLPPLQAGMFDENDA